MKKLQKKKAKIIILAVLTASTISIFVITTSKTASKDSFSSHLVNNKNNLNINLQLNNQEQQTKQQLQPDRFFICPHKLPDAARLGNILFAFGSLFGIARRLRGRVLLPERHSKQLRKIFTLKSFISDPPEPYSFDHKTNISENLSNNNGIKINQNNNNNQIGTDNNNNIKNYINKRIYNRNNQNLNYADEMCGNEWKRLFAERWASMYDPAILSAVESKLAAMESHNTNNKNKNSNNKNHKSGFLYEEPPLPILGVGKYLQSFKYFNNYKEEIVKSEFKFHDWIERRAKRIIHHAKLKIPTNYFKQKDAEDTITIGVHVRRADMGHPAEINNGYTMASEHYIKKAMEFYSVEFYNRSLLFIVATDDQEWSRKYVRSSNHTVVFTIDLINTQFDIYTRNNKKNNNKDKNNDENKINKNKIIAFEINETETDNLKEESLRMKLFDANTLASTFDLAILSFTDHSILTVGSYGWWSAYLSLNKARKVLYCTEYPLVGSYIDSIFRATDFYPHNWIGMS